MYFFFSNFLFPKYPAMAYYRFNKRCSTILHLNFVIDTGNCSLFDFVSKWHFSLRFNALKRIEFGNNTFFCWPMMLVKPFIYLLYLYSNIHFQNFVYGPWRLLRKLFRIYNSSVVKNIVLHTQRKFHSLC